MDSELFFKDSNINSIYKNKSGLYVIEQPLFSKEHKKPIFKIGYARHSLYTRIADYRTHYGLIPFKIHLLYCVPMGVRGKRVNYAHLQERVIQETLKDMNKYTGTGEWFYDLDSIMDVINTLRIKHLIDIDYSNKWVYYINPKYEDNYNIVWLEDEAKIKGSFANLTYKGGIKTRRMLIEEEIGEDEIS